MSYLSTSFPSVVNAGPLASQNSTLDLQNSIKLDKPEEVVRLIKTTGLSVNQPLVNGELPLHFAVRCDKKDVVMALLANGADPEQKDFQQLSAIDHAVLMKNEGMLASILGQKIGKDLQEIQEQIKCRGSASHVNQLKSKIQKKQTVDVANLSPLNRAAYLGDVDAFVKSSNQNINQLDSKGLAPIHYAILGNQTAALNKLIELGSSVKIYHDGDSLLHFAAAGKSQTILNKLISTGIDLNQKNIFGETALHYASANENLAVVELLVKAGANPQLLDNSGMSPLALIGASAYQRDPLSLPKTQIILFAATSLFWMSAMASAGGWVTSDEAKLAAGLLTLGSAIAANWSEFAVLVTNLNKSWKKVIAWIGMLGFAALPPISLGFQAWNTYHVARASFEGLKKCWNNVGYRNMAVARNVVVYSVNTGNSFHKLYAQCIMTYEVGLNAIYLAKIAMAYYNGDQEAFIEAYAEYIQFLNSRYQTGGGTGTVDASQCPPVDPSSLRGLSNVNRLLKPELNTNCPEHALMMMSPEFTMKDLQAKGYPLYKKVYTGMMLNEVHPDKTNADPKLLEAAKRLGASHQTLKVWLEKNKP